MKALLLLLGVFCVANAALTVRFNVEKNAADHKTVYRSPGGSTQQTRALIVRGYQAVSVSATADPFPQGAEFFLFDELSGLPVIGNGKKPAEWKLNAVVAQDRKSLTFTWDKGTIGRFYFGIRTNGKLVFLSNTKIYILFNPWNAKDATSPLDTPDATAQGAGNYYVDLKDYVLNEFGAVWRGSARSNNPMAWIYNHMDLGVLDIVMGLLTPLAPEQRTAVLVSRFLTVAAQGILEGRWPDDPNDYPGGQPPGVWFDSSQIILKYGQSGTVKYGQCWVFSSLYTALGRTLGIPTLSVSNFDSAHEQRPFKQECHMRSVGPDAKFERRISTCSIWNFHVWNHVYIKRTDVPGASGWQAVDATPQEVSREGPAQAPFKEENYFTGPASLNLMRRGLYTSNYDSGFVGGESNAVIIRYLCATKDPKTCQQTQRVTNQVGEIMLSKMPDSVSTVNKLGPQGYTYLQFLNWNRRYSNVTTSFLELENGPSKGAKGQQEQNPQSGESLESLDQSQLANSTETLFESFSVSVPSQLTVGNPFRVSLKPKPGAKLHGMWMLSLSVRTVNYMTGVAIGPDHLTIHQQTDMTKTKGLGQLVRTFGAQLWGNQTFLSYLAKSTYISFVFTAVPAGTNQKILMAPTTVNIMRPRLAVLCGPTARAIKHHDTFKQGDNIHCLVKFYNPLNIKITDIKIQMSISGLVAKEAQKQIEAQKQHKGLTQEETVANATDVDPAGKTVRGKKTIRIGGFQFTLNATPGKQMVTATFMSKQLTDIFGSNTITIKADPAFQKKQSQQSKQESQGAKQDADADVGQTDENAAAVNAAATKQKAQKVADLAASSKKASAGPDQKPAPKITLVQHTKETQKSK